MSLSRHAAPRPTSGFTLIEAAFAASILGIVAVGMIGTIGTTISMEGANRDRETARVAAQAQIERVLAWPDYTTIGTQFDQVSFGAGALLPADSTQNFPGIVTVDATVPELLFVTARVTWDAPRTGTNTYEVSVQIANPEWTVTIPQ